jgi:DNA gyrase inhibitor GyrI
MGFITCRGFAARSVYYKVFAISSGYGVYRASHLYNDLSQQFRSMFENFSQINQFLCFRSLVRFTFQIFKIIP